LRGTSSLLISNDVIYNCNGASKCIVLVTPRYLPHIGGIEYVVKSMSVELCKRGYKIIVLAGEQSMNTPHHITILKKGRYIIIRWPVLAINDAYYIPRKGQTLKTLIRNLVSSDDVILHVHSIHSVFPLWVGLQAKQINKKVKLVITPHYHGRGHSLIRNILWRIYWYKIVSKALENANIIHSISPLEKEKLLAHYPMISNKIVTIPNGIDNSIVKYLNQRDKLNSSSKRIVYAGRIEKYKRLEIAVDLIKELREHVPEISLLIIGDGPHLRELKKYASKRTSNVIFMRPVTRKKYLDLLINACATINPSRYEAYSIFSAESLFMGITSIITPSVAKALRAKRVNTKSHLFTLIEKYAEKYGLIVCNYAENVKPWREIISLIINKIYNDL